MKMTHTVDPAKAIHDQLGGVHEQFNVIGVDVMIAIYQRPETTAGSIVLPGRSLGEDEYQGKVGLILKVGPMVNPGNDELVEWFGGKDKLPRPGQWAVVRVGDTYPFDLHYGIGSKDKMPCRLVEAKLIRGIVKEPDTIW